MQKAIAIILASIFLFGCIQTPQEQHSAKITFEGSSLSINAKIADTPHARSKGLMHMDFMPQNQGMLFVYSKEQSLSFWMANTRIPLDIIFLAKDKTIVDIQKMQPCIRTDPKGCKTYLSKEKAMYALEINQNLSAKYNLKPGQKASWN